MGKKASIFKKIALDNLNKDRNIVFIVDLCNTIGLGRRSFYDNELGKDPDIMAALMRNKAAKKKGIRDKWEKDSNATTQIALYKLLADKDEFTRLTGQTLLEADTEDTKEGSFVGFKFLPKR